MIYHIFRGRDQSQGFREGQYRASQSAGGPYGYQNPQPMRQNYGAPPRMLFMSSFFSFFYFLSFFYVFFMTFMSFVIYFFRISTTVLSTAPTAIRLSPASTTIRTRWRVSTGIYDVFYDVFDVFYDPF